MSGTFHFTRNVWLYNIFLSTFIYIFIYLILHLIFRLCISFERSKVEISRCHFLCNFCLIQYVLSLHVRALTCPTLLVSAPNLHSIVIISYDLFFVLSPVSILKDLAKKILHLNYWVFMFLTVSHQQYKRWYKFTWLVLLIEHLVYK